MKVVKILFAGHLGALAFGIAGLLIAFPHPELWASNPSLVGAYNLGIRYAGSVHILFGAMTMLAFGLFFVGWRKTLMFFATATTISLSMELMGTGTGFPFGAYSYTTFLGARIAGRVPFSIPLSWFYMGFTAYILASALVARHAQRHRTIWSLIVGAYLLTVWDLALDPAMASAHLPIHFWIWHQTGPYFGMPVRNLIGWSATGLIFMSVSRLLWRANLDTRRMALWVPFGVYAANSGFAIVLSLGAGLWLPPIMAIVLGVLPASLVLLPEDTVAGGTFPQRIAALALRRGSRVLLVRHASVQIVGLENLPRSGPVIIAARHFHHLYDGCVLLANIPRPVRILGALDWATSRLSRRVMERACAMAGWPVILRTECLEARASGKGSAYSLDEASRYLHRAIRSSVQLLRGGAVLAIFPEAYPTVDPHATKPPKSGPDDFLPFRSGCARLAQLAEKDGTTRVAIVPAGLAYIQARRKGRWQITLRLDPALWLRDFPDPVQLTRAVEERVQMLSRPSSISVRAVPEWPEKAVSV